VSPTGANQVRNIVLLSDGTDNGPAKRNKTDMSRLDQALDVDGTQLAFYDNGFGTSYATRLIYSTMLSMTFVES